MLDVASVTVVFASAYLDNPASLFGHTLLRLDQRDQTERTRLLAHAINYAADDSNNHPLLYAFDGIAGGFQGRFEVQPCTSWCAPTTIWKTATCGNTGST